MGSLGILKFFSSSRSGRTCNVLLAYGDPDIGAAEIPRCVLALGSSGRGLQIPGKPVASVPGARGKPNRMTFAPHKQTFLNISSLFSDRAQAAPGPYFRSCPKVGKDISKDSLSRAYPVRVKSLR